MGLLNRLKALLRPDPLPTHGEIAPNTLKGILERLDSLERDMAELDEQREQATDRELRWAEMNAQLRRYLGRLDAHAKRANPDDEPEPGKSDPKQLAAILRTKFPQQNGA